MPTKQELQFKNDLYKFWEPEWKFFLDSYLGGKRYMEGGYLIKHPLETDDNYRRRVKVSYLYNYCKPVVDIYVSILYKQKFIRDFGSLDDNALFKSFRKDADLKGNSYTQFIREAQRWASAYGRVTVIVDKPSGAVMTQQDAQDEDIRPYLSLITPENITDWGFVRLLNGRLILDFINIVEEWKDGKAFQVRVWTRNDWAVYRLDKKIKGDVELTPIHRGEHGLGVVPAVNIYNQNTGTEMIGLSDLQDIAHINKNIYYLCSDAHEIIENTAYPMLAMPFDNSESVEAGSGSVIGFDPQEANAKPYWMEPPHSSLDAIETRISRNVREIWTISSLSGIKSVESIQPWSGIAMDIENQQRDAALKEKADNMEQAETQILKLWGLWEDIEFDGKIKYPADFSIKDIDRELEANLKIMERGKVLSSVLMKEVFKNMARIVLSKADDDVLEKVLLDIDNTNESLDSTLKAQTAEVESDMYAKELQKKIVVTSLPKLEEEKIEEIFTEIDES